MHGGLPGVCLCLLRCPLQRLVFSLKGPNRPLQCLFLALVRSPESFLARDLLHQPLGCQTLVALPHPFLAQLSPGTAPSLLPQTGVVQLLFQGYYLSLQGPQASAQASALNCSVELSL